MRKRLAKKVLANVRGISYRPRTLRAAYRCADRRHQKKGRKLLEELRALEAHLLQAREDAERELNEELRKLGESMEPCGAYMGYMIGHEFIDMEEELPDPLVWESPSAGSFGGIQGGSLAIEGFEWPINLWDLRSDLADPARDTDLPPLYEFKARYVSPVMEPDQATKLFGAWESHDSEEGGEE